MQIWLIFRKYQ